MSRKPSLPHFKNNYQEYNQDLYLLNQYDLNILQ